MSIQIIEGFDIYGGGDTTTSSTVNVSRANMLDGVWANIPSTNFGVGGVFLSGCVTPPFGARSGKCALFTGVSSVEAPFNVPGPRIVLPTAAAELFVNFAYYRETLPTYNTSTYMVRLCDGSNNLLYSLIHYPDGSIVFANSAGALVYQTDALTITAAAWNHIQVRFKANAATGAIQIKVNDVTVMDHTGINTGSTSVAMLRFETLFTTAKQEQNGFWVDDLVVNDTTGPNNTWLGETRVATLRPKADDEQGWTARRRAKFGNGVAINTVEDGSAITCSDSSDFEFSNGDFTMEGLFSFFDTPTSTKKYTLFSKWREVTNERSFELFLDNTGELVFRESTDGTAGTVAEIIRASFEPVFGHYHHICVERASNVTTLFVDGIKLAAPTADAHTYNDNTSLFCIGGLQNATSTITDNTSFQGLMEEVRITKGVARYTTGGYTVPSTAYPRSVAGGDADFASVSLLIGFDTAFIDESSHGRACTARGSVVRFAVDDAAPGDYKVVNQADPRDDTFVEAPYTAASGVLTATQNFANNETVTVDSNVYTFKTVFVDVAGNVLIGASLSASVDNLAAAINGDAGAGTLYGTGTTASDDASAFNVGNGQMSVEAIAAGTAGNAVTLGETCANADWNGQTTLIGGLNIPGPSSFSVTRLPAGTTGVRAVALVQRAEKSDAGPGKTQLSFVTADDSTANGAEHSLTTAFTFYQDIIEEDPSTSSALTPASFIGSRIRVDRTE